ncbi:hypothetical protein BH11PSE5_BH11PSE5_01400 [soil metagenome]
MIFYLESNVISTLSRFDEGRRFSRWCKSNRIRVLYSEILIQEIMKTKEDHLLNRLLSTLSEVTTNRAESISFRHSEEFISEVRRLRKEWLIAEPNTKLIRWQIQRQLRNWSLLKRKNFSLIKAEWKNDIHYDFGKREAVKAQKEFKEQLRIGEEGVRPMFQYKNNLGQVKKVYLDEPTNQWREDRFLTWKAAVHERMPQISDYADFAAPYLLKDALSDDHDALSFWFEEVEEESMPFNRITALTWYKQLFQKINRGNSGDTRHSNFLLLADYFITADVTFYNIISEVAKEVPIKSKIILIDRNKKNVAAQITEAISQAV